MTAHYDALLSALPVVNLTRAFKQPRYVRQWNYPMTKTYNGFTGEERVAGWQFMWWLTDSGCLGFPKVCDICANPKEKVNWHSENYYDTTSMAKLCNTCHMALHKRFAKPGPWKDIVQKNSRTGQEWFALLDAEIMIDLAAHIRQTHPHDNVKNLYRSTLFTKPPGLLAPNINWGLASDTRPQGEFSFMSVMEPPKTTGITARIPTHRKTLVRHRRR